MKIKRMRLRYISDRRWKKIVKVLQTSAYLNDRKEINLADCFLITYMIWDEVEQIETVRDIITTAIKNHGYSFKYNISGIETDIEQLKLDIKNNTNETKKIEYFEPKLYTIDGNQYYKLQNEGIERLSLPTLSQKETKVSLLGVWGKK